MSDEVHLSMSLPLDSDGFLRRECPTCEREFKWLSADDHAEAVPEPEGGYFCPYCAIQAHGDGWWTSAQQELAHNITMKEVVEPELTKFQRSIESTSRRTGGFISASVKFDETPEADPLIETDEMRRVDFECHPDEPVKVLDDWTRSVHCMICGVPTPTV